MSARIKSSLRVAIVFLVIELLSVRSKHSVEILGLGMEVNLELVE